MNNKYLNLTLMEESHKKRKVDPSEDNPDTLFQGMTITCWGCITEQPNQEAHMDLGGCLYIEELDL